MTTNIDVICDASINGKDSFPIKLNEAVSLRRNSIMNGQTIMERVKQ